MAKPKGKPPQDASVPKSVVSRLSLYLRELQHLLRDGQETISSTRLGSVLGFTDAQVRKDLAYFGQFGYPGIGYRCQELVTEIKNILGTNQPWPMAMVGIGNLGRALLRYKGFGHQGFRIAAAFDVDSALIGSQIEGAMVYSIENMAQVVRQLDIRLAIIAVPASAAQEVADQLVQSGIEGILNFAPAAISLPDHVQTVGVDLAIELEQLAFAVVSRNREQKSP